MPTAVTEKLTGKELLVKLSELFGWEDHLHVKFLEEIDVDAQFESTTPLPSYQCTHCGKTYKNQKLSSVIMKADTHGVICTNCLSEGDETILGDDIPGIERQETSIKEVTEEEKDDGVNENEIYEETEEEVTEDDSDDQEESRVETSEENVDIVTTLFDVKKVLGYLPFDYTDDKIIVNGDKITLTCSVCGTQTTFNSINDIVKVHGSNDGEDVYHNCPPCIKDIKQNKSDFGKPFVSVIKDAHLEYKKTHGVAINKKTNNMSPIDEYTYASFVDGEEIQVNYFDIIGREDLYTADLEGDDEDEDLGPESDEEEIVSDEGVEQSVISSEEQEFEEDTEDEEDIPEDVEDEEESPIEDKPQFETIEDEDEEDIPEFDEQGFEIVDEEDDYDPDVNIIDEDEVGIDFNETDTGKLLLQAREAVDDGYMPVFKDDNGKPYNPFASPIKPIDIFKQSVFYDMLFKVKEKAQVDFKIMINDRTKNFPIVDFECGVRLLCVDVNDRTINQLESFNSVAKRVPFLYGRKGLEKHGLENPIIRYIYSDSVKFRNTATIKNLIKIIKYYDGTFPQENIVSIANLPAFYTVNEVDSEFIDAFEKENNINAFKKPSNKRVALMVNYASNVENEEERRMLTKKLMSRAGNLSMDDVQIHMILSARYIKKPQGIKGNSIVKYVITDYTEIAGAFIADGFPHICSAILKEHMKEFGNVVQDKPIITLEVDLSSLPTPSLHKYEQKGWLRHISGGLKDAQRFANVTGGSFAHIAQNKIFKDFQSGLSDLTYLTYIVDPEYGRSDIKDEQRIDERYFQSTKSVLKLYYEELTRRGLSVNDKRQVTNFMSEKGIIPIVQPPIMVFMFGYTEIFRNLLGNRRLTEIQNITITDTMRVVSGGVVDGRSLNDPSSLAGITMVRKLMTNAMGNGNGADIKNENTTNKSNEGKEEPKSNVDPQEEKHKQLLKLMMMRKLMNR